MRASRKDASDPAPPTDTNFFRLLLSLLKCQEWPAGGDDADPTLNRPDDRHGSVAPALPTFRGSSAMGRRAQVAEGPEPLHSPRHAGRPEKAIAPEPLANAGWVSGRLRIVLPWMATLRVEPFRHE